jgi:tight adherence protein F
MKGINSTLTAKQKGTFSIEFSLVGLFFGVLLMFSADIIIKLSVKGKLDRLSYSLVSIAKERTQLYAAENYTLVEQADDGDEATVEQQDISLLYTVAKNSLSRTVGQFDNSKFSMLVEELTNDSGYQAHKTYAGSCGESLSENSLAALRVKTSWGRDSSIYRVTLCYETDNMVAGLLDNGFTRVQSSSAMIGR